jgi:ankyrin repeat protein
MIAVDNSDNKLLTFLLDKGANVNLVDEKNTSALQVAAAIGVPQMVRLLISHGADLTHKDIKGRTPTDWAQEAKQSTVIPILNDAVKKGHR